jgi:hypothetical protein
VTTTRFGNVNEINIKEDYSNPKLSINKVGFFLWANTKAVGCLNSKKSLGKIRFQIDVMLFYFRRNNGNDFEWRKRKNSRESKV